MLKTPKIVYTCKNCDKKYELLSDFKKHIYKYFEILQANNELITNPEIIKKLDKKKKKDDLKYKYLNENESFLNSFFLDNDLKKIENKKMENDQKKFENDQKKFENEQKKFEHNFILQKTNEIPKCSPKRPNVVIIKNDNEKKRKIETTPIKQQTSVMKNVFKPKIENKTTFSFFKNEIIENNLIDNIESEIEEIKN
jgi:hypothetical protein